MNHHRLFLLHPQLRVLHLLHVLRVVVVVVTLFATPRPAHSFLTPTPAFLTPTPASQRVVVGPSSSSAWIKTIIPSPSSTSSVILFAARSKKKVKPKTNIISVNRNARRNYEVLETLEVGISLVGTEVKSIRDGKLNLRDGYVRPTKDGRSCLLYNVHVGKHSQSGAYFQHEERRERRLLLHKEQARKLYQQTDQQPGMTIVPLKAYFNDQNRIKLEIGLCRGKNVRDKRDDIKNREAKREEQRIIKSFRAY